MCRTPRRERLGAILGSWGCCRANAKQQRSREPQQARSWLRWMMEGCSLCVCLPGSASTPPRQSRCDPRHTPIIWADAGLGCVGAVGSIGGLGGSGRVGNDLKRRLAVVVDHDEISTSIQSTPKGPSAMSRHPSIDRARPPPIGPPHSQALTPTFSPIEQHTGPGAFGRAKQPRGKGIDRSRHPHSLLAGRTSNWTSAPSPWHWSAQQAAAEAAAAAEAEVAPAVGRRGASRAWIRFIKQQQP